MQGVAGIRESGGDSGAEPEYPQPQRAALLSKRPDSSVDSAGVAKIRRSDAALGIFLQLGAVVDSAVHQHPLCGDSVIVFYIVAHVHHTVEIADGADITAVFFYCCESQE